MEESEKYLLQKFLTGRCTEDELSRVRVILDAKEGHEMLDNLMQEQEAEDWNNLPQEVQSMQELIRRKQAEMQQRIADHEGISHPFPDHTNRPVIRLRKYLRYAAIWAGVILLAGLAIWQVKKSITNGAAPYAYIEKINPHGIPVRYVLPDSTQVYLAAGSILKYPETYPQTGRDVELQGEAFFDVKRDEAHPFTIRSGTMQTRVLGTSFKVTAFEGQQQEVAVATGKVSVSAIHEERTTELALLTPGLKVTYNPQTGQALEGKVNVYSLEQWKAGELMIDEQPMKVVIQELERRYNVQFSFADQEAANNRVSGTFSANEPVTNVLDMLGFVGKFRYESRDGKIFTIYKE